MMSDGFRCGTGSCSRLRTGHPVDRLPCHWLTRDGEVYWMRAPSTPRHIPGPTDFEDGIVMDIDSRKREEAARRESEEHFRLLVENADLPVVITDRKSVV